MANLVYRHVGTPLTFTDSGGDCVLALNNLGEAAGIISARYDRGAGDLPVRHQWIATVQFDTAPVINEIVEIYLIESDGTYADATSGSSGGAMATAQRYNCKLIGTIYVETASADVDFIASGICNIYQRYIQIAVWNGSAGDHLQATANTGRVILTPMADEIQ
jgi:hypothetical protein